MRLIESSPRLQTVDIASVVRKCIVDAEALVEVLKGLRVGERDRLLRKYWNCCWGFEEREGKILVMFGSLGRDKSR